MKRVILYIFLILICSKVQSQIYSPFPDSGVVWSYLDKYQYGSPMNPNYFYNTHYYILTGDTLIEGVKYSKLYFTFDSTLIDIEFSGGIRQDVINKKVFFYQPYFVDSYWPGERLLYDFSKNLGDTIKYGNYEEVITSIDSILVGGKYHKRMNKNVEGMGSQIALIRAFFPLPESRFFLLCFDSLKNRGNTMYMDSVFKSCYLKKGFSEINTFSKREFVIYPNPSSKEINIEFPSFQKGEIELLNYLGQSVYKESFSDKELKVSKDQHPPGIYFLLIKTEGQEIHKKIIFIK